MKVTPIPIATMLRVAMMLLVSHMVLGIQPAASIIWSVRQRRVEPLLNISILSSLKYLANSGMVTGRPGLILQ